MQSEFWQMSRRKTVEAFYFVVLFFFFFLMRAQNTAANRLSSKLFPHFFELRGHEQGRDLSSPKIYLQMLIN